MPLKKRIIEDEESASGRDNQILVIRNQPSHTATAFSMHFLPLWADDLVANHMLASLAHTILVQLLDFSIEMKPFPDRKMLRQLGLTKDRQEGAVLMD